MENNYLKINIVDVNEIILSLQTNKNDFIKNHIKHTKIKNIEFTVNNCVYGQEVISFCCFIKIPVWELKLRELLKPFQLIDLGNQIFEIKFNDKHVSYLKYQKNFGIYIFNGRPDLFSKMKKENFININYFEETFQNTINFVELFLNLIYKDNIHSKLEIMPSANRKKTETLEYKKTKELPESLKRFYKRIGHNQ